MRTLFATLLTLSFLLVKPVFAEDLILTHIGGLATQGKVLNHWWYEPQRVILKGTGSKGANIDVTLDGVFNVTKASVENGSWQYDMGTLSVADHNVIIASGAESHSFILTIGSAPPADMSSTKGGDQLPTAGSVLPIIGIIGAAAALIFYSFKKNEVES